HQESPVYVFELRSIGDGEARRRTANGKLRTTMRPLILPRASYRTETDRSKCWLRLPRCEMRNGYTTSVSSKLSHWPFVSLLLAHRLLAYGRRRMTVFPLRRSVGLKAATASSRAATRPIFVRNRPSRTR